MFGMGYQELLLVLLIALVFFGGSKLPELARSLGASIKEFKKGVVEGKVVEGKEETTSATKKEEGEGNKR